MSQLRHDVDDVYDLLNVTNENVKAMDEKVAATNEKVEVIARAVSNLDTSVSVIKTTQWRHGNRLDELQSAVDLAVGRLDRLEAGHQRLEVSHQKIGEVQRQQDVKLDAILAALGARLPAGPNSPAGTSSRVEEPAGVGADGQAG